VQLTRRQTLAALYRQAQMIRRKVAQHWRGQTRKELRAAFGVGMVLALSKPNTIARVAAHIQRGADLYPMELRQAGVSLPTLLRLIRLNDRLRQLSPLAASATK
jgi:hypothetical protein